MATERVLYQFPISHFAEKVRWILDQKGLSYRISNLVPGLHVPIMKRLTGGRTVPALRDGAVILRDSTTIALYLEQSYDRPLLPAEAQARRRSLDLIRFFDGTAGPGVRDFMYARFLERAGVARRRILGGYPRLVRAFGVLVTPIFEAGVRRTYRLHDGSAELARRRILAAADRIEQETEARPDRYLAGESLSLVDITAASLLGPLIAPLGSPWTPHDDDPEAVRSLRDSLLDRPAGVWVQERYRRDRPRP